MRTYHLSPAVRFPAFVLSNSQYQFSDSNVIVS